MSVGESRRRLLGLKAHGGFAMATDMEAQRVIQMICKVAQRMFHDLGGEIVVSMLEVQGACVDGW